MRAVALIHDVSDAAAVVRAAAAVPSGSAAAISGATSTARVRSATEISADAVGEHVVHAIPTNAYFVFTHPEARGGVEERHTRMMAGFDAAVRYVGTR